MENVSAIVVIVEGDIHSVYIVPVEEASVDNMQRLRVLRDLLLIKHKTQLDIRIQRVWVSEADQQAKTFQDVSKQLENIITNF